MLSNTKINQYISLILLIGLGGVILFGLSSFLQSFLGATTLYVLFNPLINWTTKRLKWKKPFATTIILLLSFILVLLPILFISYSIASKAGQILGDPKIILTQIKNIENIVLQNFKIDLFSDSNMEALTSKATVYLSNFLSGSFNLLAQIGIMYFLLYFMLKSSTEMEEKIFNLTPYSSDEVTALRTELEGHVFSNVIVSPLLAFIQGICACILFWVCGLDEPFFWGIICGVFSFIPFVGSAIVWLPAGILMLAQNQVWQGVTVLSCGIIIIANVDNVFRFVLQKRFADIHPIITVLGVIIGLDWFGFTGIIFGPLLISFFLILLKSYRKDHIIPFKTSSE